MQKLVDEYRERLSRVREGGGARNTSNATVNRASCRPASASRSCSIRIRPFSSCRPCRVGDVRRRGAGGRSGDGHRPRQRPRCDDRRQRRDGEGRHLLPAHRQETRARAGSRAAEPPALRVPRGFGRRLSPAPGRGVSRPRSLRAHFLQSGAHVGRRHPADCRRDGFVHRRGRLRPGDVRRGHHRRAIPAPSFSAGRRW